MAFDWLGCVGQECAWFDSTEDSGKDGGVLSWAFSLRKNNYNK